MKKARARRGRRRTLRLQNLLLVIALVGVAALAAFMFLKPSSTAQEVRGDYRQRYQFDRIVELDGVKYRERKQLTTILLLGIDKDTEQEENNGSRGIGMADFQRLVVVDSEQKRVYQIQLDRDTMAPMHVTGPLGDEVGEADLQLCLAYAFGDGGEKSRENAKYAVSRFLLETPIDFCLALNLDGLTVLNDLVGGVEVTLEEDYSDKDPSMKKGATLTLNGEQAELYVRRRKDISDGTNVSRMHRQRQYVDHLSAKLNRRISADKNYIGTVYDALEGYLSTDMSRGRLINEVWNARHYLRSDLITLPGTYSLNERNNNEFHADEEAVRQLVTELFYEPLK